MSVCVCLCVQTLYLASMLIKALWNNALAAKAQLSKQSSFASLLNTNLPMGNKKGLFPLLPPLCSSHLISLSLIQSLKGRFAPARNQSVISKTF